ncbi:MAG: lycopene cyclase family protein [Bradymonadaceae bacterium]
MPRTETPTYDVLVVGAGPAGLAATAALAERGLRVGSLSPSHPPDWPNTYGIWRDELERAGLTRAAARTWSRATVALPADRIRQLDRTYALIDNRRLRETFRDRAARHGVDWRKGIVDEITRECNDGPVHLHTRSGETLSGRLAVDATGHRSPSGTDAGYQVAVGVVIPTDETDEADETMTLMDFRRPDGTPEVDPSDPPTFLYTMELGEGRRLYEETVLVSRPNLSFQPLEARLRRRLRARGVADREILDLEHVVIPMGRPLPDLEPNRGLLPFGAAAEMVHPATGYMVGRTLLAAEPMADAVADTLRRRSESGACPAAVRAGWQAIWPRDLVRTRHLLTFGMEALLAMDARQTHAFFDTFFSLPRADWCHYLSGRAGPARTARIMTRVFSRASLSMKAHLTKIAFSPQIRHLFRSLAA